MSISVKIPPLGESITDAVLVKWHKKAGQSVSKDEPLCELETDKANVDVPSPSAGVITTTVSEGDTVKIDQEIATIDAAGAAGTAAEAPSAQPSPPSAAPAPAQASQPPAVVASPAAQRIAGDTGIDPATVKGTGRGGRITKQDMASAAATSPAPNAPSIQPAPAQDTNIPRESPKTATIPAPIPRVSDGSGTRREPMTKIRRKIAERLVQAQQQAAILTTFNEIDLKAVQDIRAKYKERFTEVHGIGLGLMSFFVRGAIQALREFPRVNASIDGGDIVYHDSVNMGIAVSTERGLAVPVLHNAQSLSFGQIEAEIRRLATSARDGKLAIEELSGGTFTITNGGVFGSLLSTPILNPPQSGILGMHTIQKRPVVIDDKIEIRPMMYVALSYDHRLVDGRESVSFLVRLKQLLEDPARLMLEI